MEYADRKYSRERVFPFLAALLVFVMAFALAACGSEKKNLSMKNKKKRKRRLKKLEGTLKVMATSENYQPLFDKFAEEV